MPLEVMTFELPVCESALPAADFTQMLPQFGSGMSARTPHGSRCVHTCRYTLGKG